MLWDILDKLNKQRGKSWLRKANLLYASRLNMLEER